MTSSTRQLLDVLKGLPTLVTSAEREENDLSALREELVQKDKMYREKCTQFETFKGSHRDCQSRQDGDRALIDKLQKEKASLEKALREKEKELEENRQRLSKIMGMKIMDNNPEIADLSDPNRPTKLGERYGELYDNEWTDAYETLSKCYDEKQVVKKLYDIFQFVFQYCYKFSRKQEEDLKEAMLVPQSKMEEVLPDFVLKQFKDNRKLGSNEFLKSHFEVFSTRKEIINGQILCQRTLKPSEVILILFTMSQDPNQERSASTGSDEHANTKGTVKYLPNVHRLLDYIQQDLGSALEEANRVERGIPNMRNKIAEQKNTIDELSQHLKKKSADKKKLKKELEETKTRLSKLMAMRMTDNNPNIADLSDQNRPTNLAERYGEIYDNEWTDAFEMLTKTGIDEKSAINILRDILTKTYQFCRIECETNVASFEKAFTMMSKEFREEANVSIPEAVSKEFKEYRKVHADKVVELSLETFLGVLKKDDTELAKQALIVVNFLTSCFRLCWMMSIQDPPIYLDVDTSNGDPINKNKYREYTLTGSKIDYIVWPCIFIEKGGAVLYKGVAQCHPERKLRRTVSADPRLTNRSSQEHFEKPRPTTALDDTERRNQHGKQSQSPVDGFNDHESRILEERPMDEASYNQTSEHTMETDSEDTGSRQSFSKSDREDNEKNKAAGESQENIRNKEKDKQPQGPNAPFTCEEHVDHPLANASVHMPDDPEFREDITQFCSGMRQFGRDNTVCMLGEEKFEKCLNYCNANNINYA